MTEFPPVLGFLQNLQGWEVPVIIFFVLLLFGGKKLPEFARGLGKAIKEFRGATREAENTFRDALDDDDRKPKEKATASNETREKETSAS